MQERLIPFDFAILDTGVRTGTQIYVGKNKGFSGLWLFLDVTSAGGGGAETITPFIQTLDSNTGKTRSFTAYTGVTANGQYAFLCHPGGVLTAAVTGVQTQQLGVPHNFRVVVLQSGGSSNWTYQLSGLWTL